MLFRSRALLPRSRASSAALLCSAPSLQTSALRPYPSRLRGPVRAGAAAKTSVPFREHSAKTTRSLCPLFGHFPVSPEMEAPLILSRITTAEEFQLFDWVSVRLSLRVLRGGKSGVCVTSSLTSRESQLIHTPEFRLHTGSTILQ